MALVKLAEVSTIMNSPHAAGTRWPAPVGPGTAPVIPVDQYRSDKHCVVHAELAGVDPGSLEVTLSPAGELAISAYRSAREDEQLRWTAHERATGPLRRRLDLGRGIDVEAVQATHEDGVLTVTVPLAGRPGRRRIPVTRAAAR